MNPHQDFLNRLHIAAPCDVPWESMTGDHRTRHCDQCEKKVYNLANLTTEEAIALFSRPDELPCIQLWRRSDGTVLTADCPVGLRKLRHRERRPIAAAVFLALFACGGLAAQAPQALLGAPAPQAPAKNQKQTRPKPRPKIVGKIALPKPVAPIQGEIACPIPPQTPPKQ